MPWTHRTYRTTRAGERIDGTFLMAFVHNGDYFLTTVKIYRDGLIECWGLTDFDTFREKVRSGWVVTQLPPNAKVSVTFLAEFTAIDAHYWVQPEEFIKEVADEIEELNERPTTSDRCREAWAAYEVLPSEVTRENLRVAYEAIPEHNRRFVLHDQDRKDYPIRVVLYPEQYRQDQDA